VESLRLESFPVNMWNRPRHSLEPKTLLKDPMIWAICLPDRHHSRLWRCPFQVFLVSNFL